MNWFTLSHTFENSSVQEWFEYILDKIEKSHLIDINNVTIIPTPIKIDINRINCLDFRNPKTHYKYIENGDNKVEDSKKDS